MTNVTKEFILDPKAQEERVNAAMQKALAKFESNNECVECGEHPTEIVEGDAYCSGCLKDHAAYCTKDKKYYKLDNIEVCECCDMTMHADYIGVVGDGSGSFSRICDGCKNEYIRQLDDSNYPENDGGY